MLWLRLLAFVVFTFGFTVSCTLASREELPADSPFVGTSPAGEQLLPYGTAIGDVTGRSAVLWLRTEGAKAVQIEWASVEASNASSSLASVQSAAFRSPVIVTGPYTDFTLSIPLEGLTPWTRYRYRVLVDVPSRASGLDARALAASGEFTTLPEESRSVPVTFAWSGDLGGQERCRQGEAGYPIFDVIEAQHPDFFLFLGDTIYADGVCPAPPNVPGADFVATTLPEYRAKHRYQRGSAALQRLLRSTPFYVIWDDHEVKDNFSGPFEGLMTAGRQALREYWPIRIDSADPHRMYRRFRYGADLELFLLDTRQYRSRNSDRDGPDKTMLGAAQLTWLLDGLRSSTATWKLVVTSVPLSIPKGGNILYPGFDGWSGGPDGTGFERERRVIVDAILKHRLKNVVFLAGDVHYLQANAYDPDGDGKTDFYEFVAGPLSARPGRLTPPSPELHPTTFFNDGGYFNFGVVHITAKTCDVAFLDDAGNRKFSHRLTAE
ncbi:MAG TPA: alkaline phosphatase D family protein [Nitrospira sp.]|nr:alkaline phosphatase D family protein [Nitrospira sp.]